MGKEPEDTPAAQNAMTEPKTEYWRRNARRYDRAVKLLNRRFSEMALAVGEAVADADEVLEVAAGTGMVTAAAAPGVKRYVATDATQEMLNLLQLRVDGATNVEVRIADALNLDFPDDSFDAVIIANLLHLLEDPARALSEARRVLRPGGKLVVPTFAHGQGWLANSLSRLLILRGFRVATRFRKEQLDALVTEAGFEVVDGRWFKGLLPLRFVAAQLPV